MALRRGSVDQNRRVLRFLVVTSESEAAAERILMDGIARHHPEADVHVLDCDPRPLRARPAASSTLAVTQAVGSSRYVDVVMATSPAFARWAVIPVVAERLLSAVHDQTLVVISPASQLFGPIDELVARAEGGALLVPRAFEPGPGVALDGWIPELAVVGPHSLPLLRWWRNRSVELLSADELSESSRLDPWAAFINVGQHVGVEGGGRFRVSPWQVDGLRVPPDADRPPTVDGRDLVLAHFHGFDPERPWWFCPPGLDEPVVYASLDRDLGRLCARRDADLHRAGWASSDRGGSAPYPGFSVGSVTAGAYRRALADGEAPPNPYDEGQVAHFLRWMGEPPADSPTGLSIGADEVWASRPDLGSVFQSVRWAGRERFGRWLWTHGLAEGETSLELLPDPPRPRRKAGRPEVPRFGVNLIGYHGSDAGLGVAVRRVASALTAASIPWQEVRYDRTASRQRGGSSAASASSDAPYFFHLMLMAPDQVAGLRDDLGEEFFERSCTIGLWYWETDVLTPGQRAAFGLVDEVWGSTTYLAEIFERYTDKPVLRMPVPLTFPEAPPRADARRQLGFDDRFTCLFSFDFLSVADRKNPEGVVAAFQRAFPDDPTVRLIIKTINGDLFPERREALAFGFGGDERIELWDRYLSAADRGALVAACDVYVSLHRSEGLGLTMAEAMAVGTPVIATRYSGNLDFMGDDSALLVDAREVEIGPGHHYPPSGHWAEPDLEQAARHLRTLRDSPELMSGLAATARRQLTAYSAAATGRSIAARLEQLWEAASVSGTVPTLATR